MFSGKWGCKHGRRAAAERATATAVTVGQCVMASKPRGLLRQYVTAFNHQSLPRGTMFSGEWGCKHGR